ncbi:hypothetical protein [Sphingomonas sp. CFBP 8760]|uniref:hypothetical protein n=1 Tax=Sphingomonas sp. CFBP 8760 TaxID=2775282 RepID=UPI00177F08AA|nr:hypothetical protein [Sphingomonas sp. CFBP 8760]MBD8548287.1 hypothetical protein [Sphingomonas sp. CFBP 8760]
MTRLSAFSALAVTTVQLPQFASNFDWSRQPTAMGFLSYDPDAPDQTGLDLAVRIRTYGERASLLRRWAVLNMPPRPCVGWDLRVEGFGAVSHMKDRPLASLCAKPQAAGLVSLSRGARHGHGFVRACDEAGIRCDIRAPEEKLDDYYTSSHERAAAGIIMDTVAIFRMALCSVLGELRGGASLQHEIEAQMRAGLARLVRHAVAEVPVLSHLSHSGTSSTDPLAGQVISPRRA